MSEYLKGRRVIELGTMVAAPFATHILAQLGAEIIKIEPPTGDTTRSLVRGGPSGTFIAYNYGKQSLCIDLTTADGADVFRRLVATVDAVIHNLSPSAARKLGVTRADLKDVQPELIVCHISGYGYGPKSEDRATNPVAEAATGLMYDHRISGRPSRLGPSFHDQFAGCYAVIRLLATWLGSAPSEEDRDIRIGLYETGLHIVGRDLAGLQLKTQLLGRPEKEGGGEFAMPGYGAYETSDGRWIYLLLLTDSHWAKLTEAFSMAERDDSELASLRGRKKHRDRVERGVQEAVKRLTLDEAANRLSLHHLGFTEVIPLEEVLEAPQANQPATLRNVVWRRMTFNVPQFPGEIDPSETATPSELGQQSVEILSELGYSPTERGDMLLRGSVGADEDGRFPYRPVQKASTRSD